MEHILEALTFTRNVVGQFDSNNHNMVFQLNCLIQMIQSVKPIGNYYHVMGVYQHLSNSFGTNIFVIRSAFAKLRKAGLIRRVKADFQIGDNLYIQQDVFLLDSENILRMMGG